MYCATSESHWSYHSTTSNKVNINVNTYTARRAIAPTTLTQHNRNELTGCHAVDSVSVSIRSVVGGVPSALCLPPSRASPYLQLHDHMASKLWYFITRVQRGSQCTPSPRPAPAVNTASAAARSSQSGGPRHAFVTLFLPK
jgi:hypothetical protein